MTKSWQDIEANQRASWAARVRRVAKKLDLTVHVGEPGDACTVRIEELERLAGIHAHDVEVAFDKGAEAHRLQRDTASGA